MAKTVQKQKRKTKKEILDENNGFVNLEEYIRMEKSSQYRSETLLARFEDLLAEFKSQFVTERRDEILKARQ